MRQIYAQPMTEILQVAVPVIHGRPRDRPIMLDGAVEHFRSVIFERRSRQCKPACIIDRKRSRCLISLS